jgi:hypothetical protein
MRAHHAGAARFGHSRCRSGHAERDLGDGSVAGPAHPPVEPGGRQHVAGELTLRVEVDHQAVGPRLGCDHCDRPHQLPNDIHRWPHGPELQRQRDFGVPSRGAVEERHRRRASLGVLDSQRPMPAARVRVGLERHNPPGWVTGDRSHQSHRTNRTPPRPRVEGPDANHRTPVPPSCAGSSRWS